MKTLTEYIKECLDVDNFAYKFDVWFRTDEQHYQPMVDMLKKCKDRKIVTKEDVDAFLLKYNTFKVKKFVDFFDEDVKREENINVDYIYLFTKIIEHFIMNFNLQNKVDYHWQALMNGEPNVVVDDAPMANEKEEN